LLIDNDGSVTVGAPAIKGAAVTAKITEHLKGDKVIVFKKKRRKGYKKKNGHRQYLTSIRIESILATGAKASAPAKEKKAEPKKEGKKEAPAAKAEAPKAKATKTTGADDLKKIEGIGPKIASTLAAAGVDTFAKLAGTSPEKISEIISEVRGNHVTDTWPKQAEMAAAGKWDELKKWQDELDGGKA
ncbi:MAG: 50S ribosomal protein L21, partial [Flavobacteriales bacterium]|nr:50S ribosomal protein L21 [Flavobacteriales bacterium]